MYRRDVVRLYLVSSPTHYSSLKSRFPFLLQEFVGIYGILYNTLLLQKEEIE
jgi:hypothetical protein